MADPSEHPVSSHGLVFSQVPFLSIVWSSGKDRVPQMRIEKPVRCTFEDDGCGQGPSETFPHVEHTHTGGRERRIGINRGRHE